MKKLSFQLKFVQLTFFMIPIRGLHQVNQVIEYLNEKGIRREFSSCHQPW